MTNSNPSARTSQRISQPLERRLNGYALAAGAAGVGLLALAQPADAEIVYTAAHATLPTNRLDYVDINGDGVADFWFSLSTFAYHTFHDRVFVGALRRGGIVDSAGGDAAVLSKGATIGSSANLQTGRANFMAGSAGFHYNSVSTRHSSGAWLNVRNRYVGVSFVLAGQTHYGWIRVNVSVHSSSGVRALVTGYAYETIPGKSLRAGQTSGNAVGEGPQAKATRPVAQRAASLGALAAGVDCLPLWRREEEQATA